MLWYSSAIIGLMKYFMGPVVDEVKVEGGEPAEESGVAEPTVDAPVAEEESAEPVEEAVAVVAEEVAPVADSVAVSGGAAPVLDAGVNITA